LKLIKNGTYKTGKTVRHHFAKLIILGDYQQKDLHILTETPTFVPISTKGCPNITG